MGTYILRRLLFGVLLIFLSTIVSFTILKLSPGRAGEADLNPRLSKAYIEQQRRIFGLDRHPVRQYLDWMGFTWFTTFKKEERGVLQGFLGKSIKFQDDVANVIGSRLTATLALNIITLVVTWLVAVPLGIYAAIHYQKFADRFLSIFGFIGMSLPGFFLALVMLWIFSLNLQWLPPGGLRSIDHTAYVQKRDEADRLLRVARDEGVPITPQLQASVDKLRAEAEEHRARIPGGRWTDYLRHMILPVVVLTFGALAGLQRVMRGNMLDVLRTQYVITARAKGLPETKVIYKHALRNAINPLVTLFGFEFARLFTGAALLEIVINYPGMGQLVLESLRAKDQSLVMATFLIASVMLVLGNLLAEILLAWVDPRVSYA